MKKFVLFFGCFLLATMINAQVPQGFKYQTVARNNAGEILASQNISFRMTILQGELPGTEVYAETHAATTNASGLATLEIGRGTAVTGSFAAINWGTIPIFLKTEIDPAGGSAFIEMGTSELLSVPFALYAKTAGNGFSGNYNDLSNKPALWDSTWLTIKNKPATVEGYGITDAMTTAHAANGISTGNIANWNTAFGWGNHAAAGYLTSFTETDPIFGVHPASGITSGNISNWNTAFSWGNHATVGYLTSFTETDPIFSIHPSSGITSGNLSNWNTAFGWGNHATAGYLTSFTETDPIFGAHPASGITAENIGNWNTAFGWGNHAGLYRPITYVPDWFEITNKPAGQNPGDMLYWNGTQWIPVPVGSTDQVLKLNNTVPTWTSSIQVPRLITRAVTGITNYAAISGGNVSDGGDPVTERGVCWSTSPNPTIANNKTNDGSGPGTYTSNIIGLSPATTYFIRAFATNGAGTGYGNEINITTLAWYCGTSNITINHSASGGVAPVDKSVTYGTVTNIPGATTKCWITSNLGADHQATAVNDATEASAGWYWQFNRKQGYKHDGTTRTPNSTWITSIDENSNWITTNDPCALELGIGWRIPTSTELTAVDASGSWNNWTDPWNSGLKIHAAGLLQGGDGTRAGTGSSGYYWSSTQNNNTLALGMTINSSSSTTAIPDLKKYAFTLRCLKD